VLEQQTAQTAQAGSAVVQEQAGEERVPQQALEVENCMCCRLAEWRLLPLVDVLIDVLGSAMLAVILSSDRVLMAEGSHHLSTFNKPSFLTAVELFSLMCALSWCCFWLLPFLHQVEVYISS
jgi:hypothetical protein